MRLPLLFALSCLSLPSIAQPTHPSGVASCIASWRFASGGSNILVDSSGNGHDGTLNNVSSVDGFRQRPAQAMRFNGVNSFAQIPHHQQLSPHTISIVALIRFHGFYSGNCQGNNIIYKSYSYFESGCWGMAVDDQNYDQNCSAFSPEFEQMNFVSSSSMQPALPPTDYLDTNTWYMLVTTFDGDSVKRYQVAMDTTTWLTSIQPISRQSFGEELGSNGEDVFIGATQNPSFPYYLNADIDDISLFNRSLTDDEVQLMYNYYRGQQPTSAASIRRSADEYISMGNGTITVRNPAPGQLLHIRLFDLSGRLLSSDSHNAASMTIDISNLPPQLLLVQLVNAQGTLASKVWKH